MSVRTAVIATCISTLVPAVAAAEEVWTGVGLGMNVRTTGDVGVVVPFDVRRALRLEPGLFVGRDRRSFQRMDGLTQRDESTFFGPRLGVFGFTPIGAARVFVGAEFSYLHFVESESVEVDSAGRETAIEPASIGNSFAVAPIGGFETALFGELYVGARVGLQFFLAHPDVDGNDAERPSLLGITALREYLRFDATYYF